MEELSKSGIKGADELVNRINGAMAKYGYREGLVFQAQRAIEYFKRGKLLAIEVTEVIEGRVALL